MTLKKPYKRTVRMLANNTYRRDGHWQYLLHPEFASDPQHYIRAFLLIQEDLLKLFEYVEPCDENADTISLRIQELLTRVCIEIEANFTAILKENTYTNSGNWNLKNDYSLIEFTHKLSVYKVKFPVWRGGKHTYSPFANWATKPNKNWHALNWYQAYNKSKHDRHLHFDKATFDTLLNAVSGLIVLLSAQFMSESYSPNSKSMGISGNYSYDYNPEMETAIGEYFRVQFPSDWDESEKYGFDWRAISNTEEPIEKINYDSIKKNNYV
jgi:hypothetical protein